LSLSFISESYCILFTASFFCFLFSLPPFFFNHVKHIYYTPLQYSCLANPMDRVAWWATVNGVSKGVRYDLVTKQQNIKFRKDACLNSVNFSLQKETLQ
jgi:hypothetical protein